ncbi:MAG: cation-translocating P-type ATPase [Candidatus Margulisiibacteriota bacterium]|jgi:Ca2+-transporting ATPase
MKEVELQNIQGLLEKEAEEKLKKYGYNELPSQKQRNFLQILWNVVREPMLMLLLGSGLIYIILGELKDALMLLTFVFVVIGITFYQERKTERALEALRHLSSPRALVIRDGSQKRIPGRAVVIDDIIVLREGDRVPADAYVIFNSNLMLDESLLTGESLSVAKSEWDGVSRSKQPGGEGLPFVYSGTMIVQGHGLGKVFATGAKTEIGKIGKALESIREESTLLQKETAGIIKTFALAGLVLCAVVVVVYGLTRGSWINGFLAGLTLSMAMLPEEFSVVLLIFLTLGAWRLSKRQVLTRQMPAIETLGAATVLCVDKTGTLTHNKMTLSSLFTEGENCETKGLNRLDERFHDLLEFSVLASQKDPFDPIEKEIKARGVGWLTGTEHLHHTWKLIREYPLSKQLLALSHVWESPDKQSYVIATKGAPEAIADLCHFSDAQKEELAKTVTGLADKGLRLLAVAKASFHQTSLPDGQHDFDFKYIGLIGFADPVRETVPPAVKECYAAGLRVIIITGDYPGTAKYIAKQIGLANPDQVITGPELMTMDRLELQARIKTVNIFARVAPEQKFNIVNALKSNNEVVAMTGDGVNDAPALKSAHIGVAMGERGTDVARESADIVLLNDDFSSIVSAVRMGRRIYDNLKKAVAYIFAVHVPIAGMSLFPILFQLPIVLLPAHIAFMELIIDPACSTVFEAEPEEDKIMQRPPRKLSDRLFDRNALVISLLQGLSVLAVVMIVFLLALYLGKSENEARSLTFTTMVFANLMLILTNLSWTQNIIYVIRKKNSALWWVIAGTLVALFLVLYLPFLRELFHFEVLHLNDLVISFLGGAASLMWFEVLKMLNRK